MAKLTNHARGPRGITLKTGETVWLEPGESADIKKDDIAEPMPDLGQPRDEAASDDADLIAAVQAENEALKTQVEAQAAELTTLKAENEKLKKPAKPA